MAKIVQIPRWMTEDVEARVPYFTWRPLDFLILIFNHLSFAEVEPAENLAGLIIFNQIFIVPSVMISEYATMSAVSLQVSQCFVDPPEYLVDVRPKVHVINMFQVEYFVRNCFMIDVSNLQNAFEFEYFGT